MQKCGDATSYSMKAEFSFGSIKSEDVETEAGTFTVLSMANTINCGDIGEPSLPSVRKLIAVPVGVTRVAVTIAGYTAESYTLAEYGINHPIMPQQPSLRKDQDHIDFAYNQSIYEAKGCIDRDLVRVKILGTMRGVQVASLEVNPIAYTPCEGTIKVYNDINFMLTFQDCDKAAADAYFKQTFSPCFTGVYDQLFNAQYLRDTYTDNPDLWEFPVKMLVITNRMFETTLQPWIEWKTMKGFYMDVHYTDETAVGSTATSIKSFINSKYQSDDTPTFVIVVGDVAQVPASLTASQTSSTTSKVSDLGYYSMDNDYFPEMLYSRMSVETTTQLTNVINKILMYEKYTFPDDSYLGNVLLIAGSDNTWNPRVGQPTINYGTTNYFNTAHGLNNVYTYLTSYTNCYNNLNTGVGFVNYTAHGDNTMWAGPEFTVTNANALTNTNMPFIAMGNCCLAANFGYSSQCLAEALIRGENKGAVSYIGSCPETYWYEDYYFAVGATNTLSATPAMANTATGFYDTYWQDESYNTLSALLMFGNLAVTNAASGGYETSTTPLYYWQAYHVIGDGSIMPYNTIPAANNVSYTPAIFIGQSEFTVNADPGSYVCVSYDNVIYGAATVPASGTLVMQLTPFTTTCNANVVVTRQQRKPYIGTVEVIPAEGPFVTVDSYTPNFAHVGDETALTLTMKNVGVEATTGTTNVTLASESNAISFGNANGSFGVLAADATTNVSGFTFTISSDIADGTVIPVKVTSTCDDKVWENTLNITAGRASLEYVDFSWKGSFTPGETFNVTARFKNVGHYQSENAIATISSTNQYISFANTDVEYGTIMPDATASCTFIATVSSDCPTTEKIPLLFAITDVEGNEASGEGNISNSCGITFVMYDSYGDGWDGTSSLIVTFSDGTPSATFRLESGAEGQETINVTTGTSITVTFNSTNYWDTECSGEILYEDGETIYTWSYSGGELPYTFTVNCGGGSTIDLMPVVNLTAEVQNAHDVMLTWQAPARANLIGYTVYRTDLTDPLGTTTQTTFTDLNLADGTYNYIVEANYTEGDVMSNPVTVTIADGISENVANVTLFPNPVEETLFVRGTQLVEVRVFNVYGQEVMTVAALSDNVELNMNKLSAGIYVVKTETKTGSNIQRVIVK